jgi:hypothetical protein
MSTRNVERVFPIKVARREAKAGYSTPKMQQAEPRRGGSSPLLRAYHKTAGRCGAAPRRGGSGKAEGFGARGRLPPLRLPPLDASSIDFKALCVYPDH